MKKFLAGVGDAILFKGDTLIGVAKTLTDSTFSLSITADDVRGGKVNGLYGRYFHDSNLAVTLTDAMFNLEYVAATLGTTVTSGGITIYESKGAGESITTNGQLTLAHTPVAFNGTIIGWYKKPSDANWSVANIAGTTMTIPNAKAGATYCVKYFYNDENAKSITIEADYVPSELHVVIVNDLYAGENTDATKIGRLVTDIPRLQMDGNQDLSLNSSSAATVSLTGNALAVDNADTCGSEAYYGTMTEEIFGETWESEVVAIAVENSEIELSATATTETLLCRVVFGGLMNSPRKANSNFTFTSSDATTVKVDTNGVVTRLKAGTAYISVALTNNTAVDPAVVKVTAS